MRQSQRRIQDQVEDVFVEVKRQGMILQEMRDSHSTRNAAVLPALESARLKRRLRLPFTSVTDIRRVADDDDLGKAFDRYVYAAVQVNADVVKNFSEKILDPQLLRRSFLSKHR